MPCTVLEIAVFVVCMRVGCVLLFSGGHVGPVNGVWTFEQLLCCFSDQVFFFWFTTCVSKVVSLEL